MRGLLFSQTTEALLGRTDKKGALERSGVRGAVVLLTLIVAEAWKDGRPILEAIRSQADVVAVLILTALGVLSSPSYRAPVPPGNAGAAEPATARTEPSKPSATGPAETPT